MLDNLQDLHFRKYSLPFLPSFSQLHDENFINLLHTQIEYSFDIIHNFDLYYKKLK